MSTHLTIQLLGNFRLLAGDAPVTEINTPRLQALLAYLILHRHAPQARQQIAFLFWPDSNEAQARTNLRNALHQLRNHLPEAAQFLQIDASSLQWRTDAPCTLDIANFEQALQTAQKTTNLTIQRQALESAIAYYQGDLMPGCYEDWILPLREQWQRAYTNALEQLLQLLESQRDYLKAIDYAQQLLQFDPLREATYGRLMQLYALAGDRAAALRVYHTCTTTLVHELGVEPGPATRTIYEQLLKLEAPPAAAAMLRNTALLVGRDEAWTKLQAGWRQAARGQPIFALVAGEAGIGKTRLVEEMVEWASRQGIATAVAHCYAVRSRLAYAPVQEWLRSPIFRRAQQTLDPLWLSEVARLLPDLLIEYPQLTPPAPFMETWQRQRLFEALARLILHSSEPLLLVLDDLQWCDGDTLEWLHYLLHFKPKARLLLVSTLRREELPPNHPLTPFLYQLGYTNSLVEIELTRLSPQETADLAANLTGRAIDPALSARLFADTEGNPLFVVETVRAELNRSERGRGDEEPLTPTSPLFYSPTTLPAKVQAVIKARLEQLSPRAYELVFVAAVIGRAFPLDVLAQVSESDEDSLVRGLDELWQQRIIREQPPTELGADTYDFSHDKIRELAYTSLSPIRRRYLHRRVAQALENLRAAHLAAYSAQIGVHYEYAGLARQAIPYYQRAAQAAQALSAIQEAMAHLTQALHLLATLPDNPARAEQELALQMALGPLLLATKGYAAPEVEHAFQRAWELCQQGGDTPQQFQILWGLGRYYMVKPNLAKGLSASQQLLALAQEKEEPDLLVEAFCSLGTYLFHQVDLLAARAYLEQSIALYDQPRHRSHALIYGQDPCVVALAYLAWTRWCLGYPDQALAHTQAALALAQELAHPYSLVIATTYASVQCQFWGDVERCRLYAENAITLATQHGFTLWLSMATFLKGWALTRQNAFDNGFDEMQRSVELFRSTGAELGAAYFAGLLAETLGRSGQPDIGMIAMNEAFDLLKRTQDRWCEAELHRLCGELWRQMETAGIDTYELNALAEAETAFQTAINVARQQQAKLWELRATMSLYRLWQQQGKAAEARPRLAAIYHWFQEGAALPDLVEAKALLSA
ncbi:MAG: BTAD domain-containing putative transcriptional regulator [Chloroflexi bacterium]|nr:BTAD domain-containing putative transcriptional regulator [Chloroflexota bacterium]